MLTLQHVCMSLAAYPAAKWHIRMSVISAQLMQRKETAQVGHGKNKKMQGKIKMCKVDHKSVEENKTVVQYENSEICKVSKKNVAVQELNLHLQAVES